ncbi:MAG: branched-chain amino acid ABC transporter substrate-binding protein [Actinomycetes bacterium]
MTFSTTQCKVLLFTASVLAIGLLAGCGGLGDNRPDVTVRSNDLVVVTSAPLSGDQKASGEAMVNGERLALAQAQGMVGQFTVSLEVFNSVQSQQRRWSTIQVAANAALAIQELHVVAYIGESDSAATAVSLPLTNQGGILQIAPTNSYGGFTSARFAPADEPRRYYPTGRSNFGRLAPSQLREALAQARLQQHQKCTSTYIIGADSSQGQTAVRSLQAALTQASIRPAGTVAFGAPGSSPARTLARVRSSGANCVFYGGPANSEAARLLNALKAGLPALQLFAGRNGIDPSLTRNLTTKAQDATLMTSPGPDPNRLNPLGTKVAALYRAQFGKAITSDALYGYEAMSAVLDSIRRAGGAGNNRDSIIAAFHSTRAKPSVLGRYSVDANGDSSLTGFVVSRVVRGALVASPGLTAAISR